MRTRLLATSVAVLLALTLAGCSDDPQPIIEPALSTTAAPSATPNETPSSTPTPEAESESAKDFIRRWQDEAFDMQATGDTSAYLAMSLRCESCDSLAAKVAEIYADGGSVRSGTGTSTVTRLKRVGGSSGVSIFDYTLDSPSSSILDQRGEVVERFSGGSEDYQINVIKRRGQWKVVRVSRLAQP